MIIHEPEMIRHAGQAITFARIELRQPRPGFPEWLWFRIPERFEQHISLRGDAFLIPGLIAAMRLNESVEVRGTISPRLAFHLEEYQQLMRYRMPGVMTQVEVRYLSLRPPEGRPAAVGTSFSGGVDSFFTLWKHLPQNQPIAAYRITHALFILGFDMRNQFKDRYRALISRYQDALGQVEVELLSLESNLLRFNFPRLKNLRFDGTLLIGAAHLLGGLFGKFYVPSSIDYSMGMTWKSVTGSPDGKTWLSTSDSLADPFLSSESLSILHHGTAFTRGEKIETLSKWALARENLRVCQNGQLSEETLNCSNCEKCLRTMFPIYVSGKMEQFTTFEKPFRSDRDILRWGRTYKPTLLVPRWAVRFTREHKPELMPTLRLVFMIGWLRHLGLGLARRLPKRWLRQRGYFVDPLNEAGAFEDEEVLRVIRVRDGTRINADMHG